ncbi:MAG: hypothetical protein HQL15_10410 [Candidatus Omnitrophica bacterium]|nr:hypothetical protein [Candidatus Omnitrophota bacterium]
MKKKHIKSRKNRTVEQISHELFQMSNRRGPNKPWGPEEYLACNLWEVLGNAWAMADDFLDNPTLEGWKEIKHWMLDDHHFYSLKNFNPRSRREAERLVKDQPLWLMLVPLREVESRLERLEEAGE